MAGLLSDFYEVSPYEGFDATAQPDDLQGWGSEASVFEEIIRVVKPRVIVEVGTWKGASAIHFARLARKYQVDTQIICIDTWLGSPECFLGDQLFWRESLRIKWGYPQLFFTFLGNVIRHDCTDIIVPLPTTSAGGAIILGRKGIKADMIYIDGEHTYEPVLQDIKAYWNILSDNGVLIGDDYANCNAVVRAVHHFAREGRHQFIAGPEDKFVFSKNPQIIPRIALTPADGQP